MFLLLAEEAFCQSEIDHVYLCDVLPASNEKIVRFEIAMQHSSRVNESNQPKHLQPDQESRFEGETPIAKIQQILKRVTQQIHNHHITISLLADVEHVRDVDLLPNFFGFCQIDNEFRLQKQLRALYAGTLDLQSHLRPILHVPPQINLPKSSLSQLLHDFVVAQHSASSF